MMKQSRSIIAFFIVLIAAFSLPAWGQLGYEGEPVNFARYNLSGPRLGFTVIPNGELRKELEENNLGTVLSQFGWHFEGQVVPETRGPAFVIQFVPLISGVEYGKVIPHLTLAMGIRMPNGIEFGLGPNLLYAGDSLRTALVLGVGKTFNYGGVNIPLNIAVATNPDGYQFSLVFGYSIASGKRKK